MAGGVLSALSQLETEQMLFHFLGSKSKDDTHKYIGKSTYNLFK
jgi:hypothetical protein